MLEEIEFEEKNKYLLEIELPEQIIENHNDTPRKFLYSHENIGNDLENEMNNLKINPKKRRMDDGDCEKFQIKKIH